MDDLIKQSTAAELIAARDEILKLCRVIRVSRKLIGRIADRHLGEHHYLNSGLGEREANYENEPSRRKIDAEFWRFVVESTFLTNVMTEKAKADFIKRNDESPLPFTESEFVKYTEHAQEYYASNAMNTVKEVYERLFNCRYNGADWHIQKRDNCRKIESSFRIRGSISYSWGKFRDAYSGGSIYEDLLTACYLLDRGTRPGYESSFRALSAQAFNNGGDTVETPYFTVKAYKNGNQAVKWNPGKLKVLADLNRHGNKDSNVLPDIFGKRYKAEHFNTGLAK